MIGFVVGTIALVALIRTIARGRFAARGRTRLERGVNGPLRTLFQRLDTTPGQERVIAEALHEARGSLQDTRGEFGATRRDLIAALRADHFDPLLLEPTFDRHDAKITALRSAAVGALAKVHDALDPAQREKLAALIRQGSLTMPPVQPRDQLAVAPVPAGAIAL